MPGIILSKEQRLPLQPFIENNWILQYTFQNSQGAHINLKDIYIKQDNENFYFRFTSYNFWESDKDFSFGVFLDVDQNINTGLHIEGCYPLGYDLLIGFNFHQNDNIEGFIGVYNTETNHFEINDIIKAEECCVLPRSLTFSISKQFFFDEFYGFDYIIRLLYDYGNDNLISDTYPDCGETLSYPPRAFPVHLFD